MARVFTQAEAKQLGLPGRKALEIVSGARGARGVTLRLAEIPVPHPGETLRGPHLHYDFEECIYVLSGTGTTLADSGECRAGAGQNLYAFFEIVMQVRAAKRFARVRNRNFGEAQRDTSRAP